MLFSIFAYGHARIAANSDVKPRNTNPGLKVAPCGMVASTTSQTVQAGSVITFRWEETINHPGSYFIEFSPGGDTNWVRLKTIVDVQNNTNDLPHQYDTQVTIPNVPCDNCALRLVQEMTDRNPPTYYYSCGDIRILAGTGTTDPPAPPVPDDYGGSPADCH